MKLKANHPELGGYFKTSEDDEFEPLPFIKPDDQEQVIIELGYKFQIAPETIYGNWEELYD